MARAGTGRITLAVDGLDALLERLAAQRIEHEPIETYSNGVRHVNIPDPDGNAIAFAEPPDESADAARTFDARGAHERVLAALRERPERQADDGTRTHDPWLGKPMLYQLSYVRVRPEYRESPWRGMAQTALPPTM